MGEREWGTLLRESVDRFCGAKILAIGDIIMDTYIWGSVDRISPEAPVPVVRVERETQMLGGVANVIHNMATLGACPILCGVIGEDLPGHEIVKIISNMNLITDGVFVEHDRPTSTKTRVVAHSQHVVRFDRESRRDIRPETARELLRFVEKRLHSLDAIVVSDYGKGVISAWLMKALRKLVRSSGESVIIAVDPKADNFEYYNEVDVITPNHHEAGAFCHFEIFDEETLEQAGRQILDELDCRSVLITQGKDGATLFEEGGEITHIPTRARKVFDVTGAGDTVISTLVLGLASGMDPKSAATLSNLAAGIVVGELGTSAVKAEELKKVIGEVSLSQESILI